jgi:uncharacterized protein with PQ loop repeat
MTFHNAVTALLVWLLTGSLTWWLLYGFGLIDRQIRAFAEAGRSPSILSYLVAVLMVIVLWPKFLGAFVQGWRERR